MSNKPLNARLETLRSILHDIPDEQAWQELCDALDRWPEDDDLRLGLEYCERHLEQWPDALRTLPRAWRWRMVEGLEEPRARLVRAVVVRGSRADVMSVLSPAKAITLKEIVLDQAKLTKDDARLIPRAARHLRDLEQLRLPWNDIGDEGIEVILEGLELGKLRGLDLTRNGIGPAGMGALAAKSPGMMNLESLNLSYNALGVLGVEELSAANLPRLSELLLDRCDLAEPHILHLSAAKRLGELRHLRLAFNALSDTAGHALGSSPLCRAIETLVLSENLLGRATLLAIATEGLDRLERLDIAGNRVDAAALKAMTVHPECLPSLRHLDLSRNRLGAAGAKALALWPGLEGVTHLSLSGNRIGKVGVRALSQSDFVKNIRSLALNNNDIGPAGLEALCGCESFARLERLEIGQNRLEDASVAAFVGARGLGTLKHLDLSWNRIGAGGAATLMRWAGHSALEHLALHANPLGPDGAKALARMGHFTGLRTLDLGHCEIGAGGIHALSRASWAHTLETLEIMNNAIGDQGAEALATAQGLTGLVALDLHNNEIGTGGLQAISQSSTLAASIKAQWSRGGE